MLLPLAKVLEVFENMVSAWKFLNLNHLNH